MRIGVSGVSGKLGGAVLKELAEKRGVDGLVAITRTPANLMVKAEVRRGDYDDPAGLASAYAGIDRLLIIPSADLRPGVRGTQLKNAIDAAVRAGVEHIFLFSAAGTHERPEFSLGGAYWAGEQHLIKSAQRWTIIRMNYYAESMADEIKMSQAQAVLMGLGAERVAYVSRGDLAAAAAGALMGEGHEGAIYNGTGPAVVSGEERALIVAELLGKPIAYAVIGEEQLRAALAPTEMPGFMIDALIEIKHTFVRGNFDIVTGDIERLSGNAPRSLRDILAQQLL